MSDTHDDLDTGAFNPHGPNGHLPAPLTEPLPDPGLPEHEWRPTDVDPRAERRAERQVATLFGLSGVFTVLFVASYVCFHIHSHWNTFIGLGSTQALGLCLGGALLCIGIGIIHYARKLMGDHEIVEMRHPARSSDDDREATVAALNAGIEESGLGRRPLVRNSLLGAISLVAVPGIVMLRDLGPTPNETEDAAAGTGLDHTVWGIKNDGQDMRVVRDVVGTPIRPGDLEIGDLVNGLPEQCFATDPATGEPYLEGTALQVAKAKAAIILVKMDPADFVSAETRNWSVDGCVVYSKICTHVGCPISLYERTTHHVLCPCHQSTFDLADSARVIFGPAARPLPQLPLGVDSEGYLVAKSDFTQPVGPSFWERG